MSRSALKIILVLSSISIMDCIPDTSSDYLKQVMSELNQKSAHQTQYRKLLNLDRPRIVSSSSIPSAFDGDGPTSTGTMGTGSEHAVFSSPGTIDVSNSYYHDHSPSETHQMPSVQMNPGQAPPLTLTKGELSALYKAAVSKGSTVNLNTLGGSQVKAAVHQMGQVASGSNPAGYYYYYYPIKSFLNDGQAEHHPPQTHAPPPAPAVPSYNYGLDHQLPIATQLHPTLVQNTKHEHTHQHKVQIDPQAMVMMTNKQKAMEPLFMAISGFIGMALMFIFSTLFLPRLSSLKSRGVTLMKQAPDELASLTRLVMASIDGQDCTERIHCEVGRAVRLMRLDDKPLRVLKVLLPPRMSKQIGQIKKASMTKKRCTFIQCKKKIDHELESKQVDLLSKQHIINLQSKEHNIIKPSVVHNQSKRQVQPQIKQIFRIYPQPKQPNPNIHSQIKRQVHQQIKQANKESKQNNSQKPKVNSQIKHTNTQSKPKGQAQQKQTDPQSKSKVNAQAKQRPQKNITVKKTTEN